MKADYAATIVTCWGGDSPGGLNQWRGPPEALIVVRSPCVMEAVTYGRKKVSVAVKWDNNYNRPLINDVTLRVKNRHH